MVLLANWPIQNDAKTLKEMTKSLSLVYASMSTWLELSHEYKHDMV